MGGGMSQGRRNAGASANPMGEEVVAPVEEVVDKSIGCTGVIASSLCVSAGLAGNPGGGTNGFISGITP